jgi:hypothetical protein
METEAIGKLLHTTEEIVTITFITGSLPTITLFTKRKLLQSHLSGIHEIDENYGQSTTQDNLLVTKFALLN